MKIRHQTRQLATTALAFIILALPDALRAQIYTITDLGTPGQISFALNLNSKGQVVGSAENEHGDMRPFLYSNGVMTDLGSLGGAQGYARGINDAGFVVGDSSLATGGFQAFLYWDGVMLDMQSILSPVFAGSGSTAFDINNANQIAGSCDVIPGRNSRHPFLLTQGIAQDFGLLGGTVHYPFLINASGTMCGTNIGVNQLPRAFVSRGASLLDIGTLGGASAFAYDINDANVVVGSAQNASGQFRAYLWNGRMTDLGTVGGLGGWAMGVNNHNQVVGGDLIDDGQALQAFYWSAATGMVSLNTWLPADSGWELVQANAINDSGQIVGWGYHWGEQHAFLMTPAALRFSINPTAVSASVTATGTINLSVPAGSSGGTLHLKSSNTNVATVPASVNVAAGATTVTFPVTTKTCNLVNHITLTASLNGVTTTATLTVNPSQLVSITPVPTTVQVGQTVTETIALDVPAGSLGRTVTLISDSTGIATVPASVKVAAGRTTVTFSITGVAPGSANIQGKVGNVIRNVKVVVTP